MYVTDRETNTELDVGEVPGVEKGSSLLGLGGESKCLWLYCLLLRALSQRRLMQFSRGRQKLLRLAAHVPGAQVQRLLQEPIDEQHRPEGGSELPRGRASIQPRADEGPSFFFSLNS